MSNDSQRPWWQQAAAEIWRNTWMRGLAFIFIAFEVYNAAVLPAIRGTQDAVIGQNKIGQSKAEECSAKFKALMDTVPMDQLGTEVSRLRDECRSLTVATPAQAEPAIKRKHRDWKPDDADASPPMPSDAHYPTFLERKNAELDYINARIAELEQSGPNGPPPTVTANRIAAEAKLRSLGIDPAKLEDGRPAQPDPRAEKKKTDLQAGSVGDLFAGRQPNPGK